jgi:hypothetical protein
MLKVTSGLETLFTTEKDSWGVEYPSGFQIFRGYYYDNSRKDPLKITGEIKSDTL